MTNLTGTKDFVHCTATIEAHFPVGIDGKAKVCCDNCFYYRSSSNRCGVTMMPCYDAKKYVGSECPFLPALEEYFTGKTKNEES